jgi:hypothetical protein
VRFLSTLPRLLAFGPVWLVWSAPSVDVAPARLGVQECDTRCQTDYTDCIDRCDGVRACQESCTRTVNECVTGCRNPAPKESAAPKAPGPPASSSPPSDAAPRAPGAGKTKPAAPKPAKPNVSP